MSHISVTALTAAEDRIAELLEARDVAVYASILGHPTPNWPEVDDHTVARKVLGLLLDTGWTPPTDDTADTSTGTENP